MSGTLTQLPLIGAPATSLLSVTSNPAVGVLGYDRTLLLTLTFSGAVSVTGGRPTLTLNDGGTATFDPLLSTGSNLVFSHTVQLGESSAALSIVATDPQGAALTDLGGNPVSLAAAVGPLLGVVAVDTTPPAVLGVSTDPWSGDFGIGTTISFLFDMSEVTTVLGGIPTLSLNDGGLAVFNSAGSTARRLVFTHLLQQGENVAALAVIGVQLNGAAISDGFGNASFFADALVTPSGTIRVDTTSPTVTAIATDAPAAILTAGQTLSITLTVSEAVTVAGGTPTLTLSDGASASFDPTKSTPTSLVFVHSVPAGLATGLAITGFSFAGATIADGAGNGLQVSGALGLLPGNLAVATAAIPLPALTSAGSASGDPTAAITTRTIDVYRFFNTVTGTHFLTTDDGERRTILATRPDLVAEGVGLRAIDPASNDPDAVPVFRFFDRNDGTQFLTASAAERDTIVATRTDLAYEPASTMFEHAHATPGDVPVYRFFDSRFGTHFYTDSAAERATIIATRPDLVAEGIGFYERLS